MKARDYADIVYTHASHTQRPTVCDFNMFSPLLFSWSSSTFAVVVMFSNKWLNWYIMLSSVPVKKHKIILMQVILVGWLVSVSVLCLFPTQCKMQTFMMPFFLFSYIVISQLIVHFPSDDAMWFKCNFPNVWEISPSWVYCPHRQRFYQRFAHPNYMEHMEALIIPPSQSSCCLCQPKGFQIPPWHDHNPDSVGQFYIWKNI